jgi:hypothetical protein
MVAQIYGERMKCSGHKFTLSKYVKSGRILSKFESALDHTKQTAIPRRIFENARLSTKCPPKENTQSDSINIVK